jgi:hypothetical protein
MPILKSATAGPVRQRILIGAGLGAALGLQAWRLAAYLSGTGIPRLAVAWVLLSHILLGVAIAATAHLACWWKRGLPLGLIVALPGAAAAYGAGWPWASAAQGIGDPLAGLLLAFLVDVIRPALRRSARVPESETASSEASAADIRTRLRQGHAELERLDTERRRRGDPRIGKSVEERIVWGELLELELQDLDERVSRKGNAEGGSGRPEPPEHDER